MNKPDPLERAREMRERHAKSRGDMPGRPDPRKIAGQIAEVKRELAIRERVYPKWVKDGRVKQSDADARILALRATLGTLRRLQLTIERLRAHDSDTLREVGDILASICNGA